MASFSCHKCFAIVPFLLAFPFIACAQNNAPNEGKKLTTIILDPGHGGKDPGAIGSKYKEKNIVLDIALKLGKIINDSIPELKVVYTRDRDTFVPLDERAAAATKNAANLFISIHANSSSNKSVFGAETFLLGQHRSKENLEVAQKENAVITLEDDYTSKYEGFDPSQPESVITFAGMQSDYINKSIDIAVLIQNAFKSHNRADRGVKQAGFLVLRQVPMPSVLIELGFISNKEEEVYMASTEGAMELAAAIFQSIKQFKTAYDDRQAIVKTDKPKPKAPKRNLWPASVNFRIQVAAASKPQQIDTLNFSPLSTQTEDGVTRYMIGICPTLEEAKSIKEELQKKYPDCFIVAFEGKERISLRSAKKKIKK